MLLLVRGRARLAGTSHRPYVDVPTLSAIATNFCGHTQCYGLIAASVPQEVD